MPAEEFLKNLVVIRAAERNFQLVVDLASDINAQILVDRGKATLDSYKQSFLDLIPVVIMEVEPP